LVNRLLEPLDHTVAHSSTVPSFDRFVQLLDRAGLTPQTVIDIGVAYGTPWLYAAFPAAKYHLVDPTRESLPHM
jgi:FkbM family methyltransferase